MPEIPDWDDQYPERREPVAARVPDDAPAPPDGCEWRHTTLIREGDKLYMGDHEVFGTRETFFHRVVKIEEKEKTFRATLVPTHPRMIGSEQRRWRKDEWLLVKRELGEAAIAHMKEHDADA